MSQRSQPPTNNAGGQGFYGQGYHHQQQDSQSSSVHTSNNLQGRSAPYVSQNQQYAPQTGLAPPRALPPQPNQAQQGYTQPQPSRINGDPSQTKKASDWDSFFSGQSQTRPANPAIGHSYDGGPTGHHQQQQQHYSHATAGPVGSDGSGSSGASRYEPHQQYDQSRVGHQSVATQPQQPHQQQPYTQQQHQHQTATYSPTVGTVSHSQLPASARGYPPTDDRAHGAYGAALSSGGQQSQVANNGYRLTSNAVSSNQQQYGSSAAAGGGYITDRNPSDARNANTGGIHNRLQANMGGPPQGFSSASREPSHNYATGRESAPHPPTRQGGPSSHDNNIYDPFDDYPPANAQQSGSHHFPPQHGTSQYNAAPGTSHNTHTGQNEAYNRHPPAAYNQVPMGASSNSAGTAAPKQHYAGHPSNGSSLNSFGPGSGGSHANVPLASGAGSYAQSHGPQTAQGHHQSHYTNNRENLIADTRSAHPANLSGHAHAHDVGTGRYDPYGPNNGNPNRDAYPIASSNPGATPQYFPTHDGDQHGSGPSPSGHLNRFEKPVSSAPPAASSKWGVPSVLPQIQPQHPSTHDGGQPWQARTGGQHPAADPSHRYQPHLSQQPSSAPGSTLDKYGPTSMGAAYKGQSPAYAPKSNSASAQQHSSSAQTSNRWGANPLDSQLASMSSVASMNGKGAPSANYGGKPGGPSLGSRESGKYGATSSAPVTTNKPRPTKGYAGRDAGRSRSRSRSPVSRRRSRSRSNSRGRSNRRSAVSRSPPRATKVASIAQTSSPRKFELSSMTATQLSMDYHCPEIGKFGHSLSTQDLLAKFPNLYVPTDFVRLEVDWPSVLECMQLGTFTEMTQTAASLFESNPAPLSYESTDPRSNAILEPPKFTYLTPEYPLAHTANVSMISNFTNSLDPAIQAHARHALSKLIKPVKFNARVIITLGFRDSETERVDHTMLRKLRILCGRRKGGAMLLGGSWSRELDGGDPMLDRSCLLNTVRRSVLSQSLLDVGDSSMCSLAKICELCYHRPQEDIKGKVYPEQDEITAVYLCTVSTRSSMVDSIFEQRWQLYSSRVSGKFAGPFLNGEENEDFTTATQQDTGAEGESPVAPTTEIEGNTADLMAIEEPAQYEPEGGATEQVQGSVDSETAREISSSTDPLAVATSEITPTDSSNNADSNDNENGNIPTLAPVEPQQEVPIAKEATQRATSVVLESSCKSKPTTPCVFLCTQPLPKDVNNDSNKKNDAISLRILPMHSLLSYTQDDSNERIFEASIAVEVLKCNVIVHYANLVADFLMARIPQFQHLVDPRMALAVQKLSKKCEPLKAMQPKDAKNTVAVLAESKEGDLIPVADTGVVEEEADEVALEDGSGEARKRQKVAQDDLVQQDEHKSDGNLAFLDPLVEMTEEDAKHWHQNFLSACRWFDLKQDRFLKAEHLQVIVGTAMRDISKSDQANIVWESCQQDDKLRYESLL